MVKDFSNQKYYVNDDADFAGGKGVTNTMESTLTTSDYD